jgi:hypothetical protein
LHPAGFSRNQSDLASLIALFAFEGDSLACFDFRDDGGVRPIVRLNIDGASRVVDYAPVLSGRELRDDQPKSKKNEISGHHKMEVVTQSGVSFLLVILTSMEKPAG